MTGFRIFGIVLAIVGVAAAAFPGWFGAMTRAALWIWRAAQPAT